MPQVTALSPLGTPGQPYSFAAKSGSITYVTLPAIHLYTSADWGSTVVLQVTMRAAVGEAHARLWDKTAAAAVASSDLSTTSSTSVRLRTGALTLVDGNEYQVQLGSLGSDDGRAAKADLMHI